MASENGFKQQKGRGQIGQRKLFKVPEAESHVYHIKSRIDTLLVPVSYAALIALTSASYLVARISIKTDSSVPAP